LATFRKGSRSCSIVPFSRDWRTTQSTPVNSETGAIEARYPWICIKTRVAFEKRKISSLGYAFGAVGFVTTFLLSLALLIPIHGSSRVDNYVIILSTAYGVVMAVWWFIFQ